ncbi:MAG: tetratricopeptide repeat protein [Sedimentisphaerales bacterium]|nr:tetratricopeptide repeat protein [Sedimentisphaerales bacterium]
MKFTIAVNRIFSEHKSRIFVLTLIIILFIESIAWGIPQQQKNLSCRTLRSMARVYMAYGEYTKAQPLAEMALDFARKRGESDSELAMCLIDLATLYEYQGKLPEAADLCEQGLILQEKVLYKSHPYVAYTLRTLSSIYLGQGDYNKAADTMNKAVAIMLESHSRDDKALAPFWVDIASILAEKGDYEEAESYYAKAMNLINTSYGPDHLYTANVLGSVAKLYTLQGKHDQAEQLIDGAIAKQEKIYGIGHHLVAPSWLIKARICRAKGNNAESEGLFKKALESVRKSGNMSLFAKLEKNVEEIRADKQGISMSVAKAVDKNTRATR